MLPPLGHAREQTVVHSLLLVFCEGGREPYPGKPRVEVSTVHGCEDREQSSHTMAGPLLGLASSKGLLNNHLYPPPPAGSSLSCSPRALQTVI